MISFLQDIPGITPPAAAQGHHGSSASAHRPGAKRDQALTALEAGVPVCLWQVAAMPDHTAFRDPMPMCRSVVRC
ncbi:MAG: hypothetical protein R2839_07635 [Thermomicrobiales bacterium]